MFSPVIGGMVRLWVGEEAQVWRIDDPESLRSMLGQGGVARTGIEPRRFREVGLLQRSSGTLFVPERPMAGEAASGETDDICARARPFVVTPGTAVRETSGEDWREFHTWLAAAVPAAAERGEFVVIERGGWDPQPEPYALAICAPDDGRWMSHVEAVPPPPDGSSWPRPESPTQKGQTVTAPANKETLRFAAVLLVDAAIGWAKSPLDLAITFGSSPHGPYVASTEDP
ncbi:MAG TPA: hypothetical protein VMK12_11025 [Anaeromyxobacteraceae bacterium]|nr:hypothetical protein [Anaeromyxobacteraceae bacterium]